jgi:2-polyprenyl-3-methyl-5-hydroxy-6-metoxy-1,4-benzoquinol methylase
MSDTPAAQFFYSNRVYLVPTMDAAKHIILTPLDGMSTEYRWKTETPYLSDLIYRKMPHSTDGKMLDYGCGVGRISKALLERSPGLMAAGYDSSLSMLYRAQEYVADARFFSVHPRWFDHLHSQSYLRFDFAVAIWVLQHCASPEEDIERIRQSLSPAGSLFVLNEKGRCVPTVDGQWVNDGIDIRKLLHQSFHVIEEGEVDQAIMGHRAKANTFWGVYSKR